MRIAPHQIHNVLNAYAKRLSHIQDAMNNAGAPPLPPDPDACSVEDKRRLIVSKISTHMIERMVLTRHKPGPEPDSSQTPKINPRHTIPTDRFTYRMITPTGEKITVHMEIEDPGFLIRQMDVAARDA
ncbi:MAG: hypothetical protein WA017_12560 [Desulfosalsimonadaceae bacterium]